jgi:hypothetical protein
MNWNLPESVSYTNTGWWQYYPSTLDGSAYYPNILTHDCTDGWLFITDGSVAVENADGSQVACDPVPMWKNDTVLVR